MLPIQQWNEYLERPEVVERLAGLPCARRGWVPRSMVLEFMRDVLQIKPGETK